MTFGASFLVAAATKATLVMRPLLIGSFSDPSGTLRFRLPAFMHVSSRGERPGISGISTSYDTNHGLNHE